MSTTITPTTIALAAEALNRCEGLTPLARRLGHELLNATDRTTGLAWPSEARLAETLNVTTRAIRKAKVQLHQRGLLTWKQRGRHPQRTPIYELAWKALIALARRIKIRVKRSAERYRPRSTPPPDRTPDLGRNTRSAYLPQKTDRNRFGGIQRAPGKPVQRQTGSDRYSPSLLQRRAHTRLWEALTSRLPEHHLGNLIDAVAARPEIEKQALDAEQQSWGSGLPLLLRLATEKVAQ